MSDYPPTNERHIADISRIEELVAENAKLNIRLQAVEHKLGEYMATQDPVAVSYAVQLRRVMNRDSEETMCVIVERAVSAYIYVPADLMERDKRTRAELLCEEADKLPDDAYDDSGTGYRFFDEDGEELL